MTSVSILIVGLVVEKFERERNHGRCERQQPQCGDEGVSEHAPRIMLHITIDSPL